MKHEPRSVIHIEKQLEWACKLGGKKSLEISRAEKTVLARLMESHIWHQPASSDSVGGGFRKGTMAPAFPPGRKLSLCSHLNASHFNFSLYTTDAF